MRAIVTGGSHGIGKAICEQLRVRDVTVLDLSKSTGCDLLYRPNRELDLEVDILVNCAGYQERAPAITYPLDQWDKDLELNLTAAFDLCKRVAPYMRANDWGRIVNISSIAGIQGTRNIIGYSVAKAGLIEMTKCLSNEWAPYGITVNAVAPGYIVTDMLLPLLNDEAHADLIRQRIPIGFFGLPVDVANLVDFLCSDKASYITGQTIAVDGGWLAR
jgi:2-deoxy-D-gluconate 3-dehydrogenase